MVANENEERLLEANAVPRVPLLVLLLLMAVVAFIFLLRFDASAFSSSGTCVCTQSCLCVVSRPHKILLFDMPFFFLLHNSTP